ncbi:sugar transferase [Sphingomonas sp. M6A6_1c]
MKSIGIFTIGKDIALSKPACSKGLRLIGYATMPVLKHVEGGRQSVGTPTAASKGNVMHDRGAVTALFLRVSEDHRRDHARALALSLKRLGDIVGASLALALFLPIMIVIAIAVAATSHGPIVYRHERIGRSGKRFACLKFRTMHRDGADRLTLLLTCDRDAAAQWARARKLDRDPRIAPIGRLLRASSLDELPQLVNVLLGDMSLVGPRPVTADELTRYGTSVDDYLSVRPGVTGLWQVNGRNQLTYGHRVRLDADYARCWSLGTDLLILLRTPMAVLMQSGAR